MTWHVNDGPQQPPVQVPAPLRQTRKGPIMNTVGAMSMPVGFKHSGAG